MKQAHESSDTHPRFGSDLGWGLSLVEYFDDVDEVAFRAQTAQTRRTKRSPAIPALSTEHGARDRGSSVSFQSLERGTDRDGRILEEDDMRSGVLYQSKEKWTWTWA
jgi:hypothetical protein